MSAMLHGLGDCTPEFHCGCGGFPDSKFSEKARYWFGILVLASILGVCTTLTVVAFLR